ncbi:TonB family protein [Pluralibacter gergoviae]|uniref:TonB family protein n=1 Tax=Pluralibacter gergoviae TaxID=61647 RepID=UPI00155EDB61|nr:TonB family protein [Pluralibacter gergoviae]
MKTLAIAVITLLLGACSSSSSSASEPVKIHNVFPLYPARAMAERKTGIVTLRYDIDNDGNVQNLRVVRAEPAGYFERQARAAVRQWKYEPGKPFKDKKANIKFTLNRTELPPVFLPYR